ncbi:MAG: hypothetical protein U0Y82_02100 [Thermoleophilia bacterium]
MEPAKGGRDNGASPSRVVALRRATLLLGVAGDIVYDVAYASNTERERPNGEVAADVFQAFVAIADAEKILRRILGECSGTDDPRRAT